MLIPTLICINGEDISLFSLSDLSILHTFIPFSLSSCSRFLWQHHTAVGEGGGRGPHQPENFGEKEEEEANEMMVGCCVGNVADVAALDTGALLGEGRWGKSKM